ncbi:MAG: hypothetical protein DI565_12870 [Ancylobacter novellus]|uniref:Uncharacterized protein n=1 Tax=Ancylobacter novellus TaxID=921 RepID=A0A2W5KAY1_ANCNO|nr:MAG: hypothetical protein DI565_12870 [Ancylobacter novellus]
MSGEKPLDDINSADAVRQAYVDGRLTTDSTAADIRRVAGRLPPTLLDEELDQLLTWSVRSTIWPRAVLYAVDETFRARKIAGVVSQRSGDHKIDLEPLAEACGIEGLVRHSPYDDAPDGSTVYTLYSMPSGVEWNLGEVERFGFSNGQHRSTPQPVRVPGRAA